MAEHLSQSELDYPFKLLEYFNGFRVSKVVCSGLKISSKIFPSVLFAGPFTGYSHTGIKTFAIVD